MKHLIEIIKNFCFDTFKFAVDFLNELNDPYYIWISVIIIINILIIISSLLCFYSLFLLFSYLLINYLYKLFIKINYKNIN